MEETKKKISISDMQHKLEKEIFPANRKTVYTFSHEEISKAYFEEHYSPEYQTQYVKFFFPTQSIYFSMSMIRAKICTNSLKSNPIKVIFKYNDTEEFGGWDIEYLYEKNKKIKEEI